MQSLSLFCTNFGSPKESNYVNCSSYCLRPSVGQSVSQLVESLRMLNVSQRFRPCFAAPHYPIMSAALFHCWSVSQTEYTCIQMRIARILAAPQSPIMSAALHIARPSPKHLFVPPPKQKGVQNKGCTEKRFSHLAPFWSVFLSRSSF